MPWNDDLPFGELGEIIVWKIMTGSQKTLQAVDVRNDEYFRQKDIDFLQQDRRYNVNKIEVKTDRKGHKTRNIVYETQSNSNAGCLARSDADYVYYYFEESKELFGIDLPKLRKLLPVLKPEEKPMGDNARGYLLSVDDLIKHNVARKKVLPKDINYERGDDLRLNAECSQKQSY